MQVTDGPVDLAVQHAKWTCMHSYSKLRHYLISDATCLICCMEPVQGTKATALRHALRQSWKVPDELSFNYTGPDWVIVLLNKVDKDIREKLMLLFWRIWHHRNDVVFGKGDCPIYASVIFLENYLASLNLGVISPSTSIKGKSPYHF